MKWKTKDGREIEISNMETSHIENTLAMLKRNGAISVETLEFYLTCHPPNGDMAMDAFEKEFEDIVSSPVCKAMGALERELEKRKIG